MPATFIADLKNQAFLGATIKPQAVSTSATGTGIDLQTTDGPVNILLTTGAATNPTGATLSVKIEESDDNTTFTETASFTALTGSSIANVASFYGKYLRNKRYLRAVATVSGGSSPSVLVSVTVIASLKIAGSGNGSLAS